MDILWPCLRPLMVLSLFSALLVGTREMNCPSIILLLTSSSFPLLLCFSSLLFLLVLLVLCIYLSDVVILRDPQGQLACDSSQSYEAAMVSF